MSSPAISSIDHALGALPEMMAAARVAQARWAATPIRRRLAHVRDLRGLIAQHSDTLAEASAAARKRPALESLTAEVLPLAETCRFLEREAPSILAPRTHGRRGLPLWLPGVRSVVTREPFGVVLIIGPGNYPLLLPGVQLIQALVAGNAVLLKPGVGGAMAARALLEIIQHAGFDSNLVTLLPDSTAAAQAAIKALPDKVVFTGSAITGEKILAQLSPRLIPATMELSGCDASIVRADADLDLVVKAIKFGLTLNNGATCMAPKRVFVHRSVATELEGRLARVFSSAHSQHAPAPGAELRESIESASGASRKLSESISLALAQGAHFIAGAIDSSVHVRTPVILAGVPASARILHEDHFAPVLALVTVISDAEAVARTNDCPYALGASVFTRSESTARNIAAQLQAGVVTINDLIIPTADARLPFGGRNRSGFGVTRGAEGLLELTSPKVVTVSRSRFRPALEPAHPKDKILFQSYLALAHGKGFRQRLRALTSLIRSLSGRYTHSNQETP